MVFQDPYASLNPRMTVYDTIAEAIQAHRAVSSAELAAEGLERQLHPYTKALASAMPLPDPERERTRRRILLAGDPPSPVNPPAGCPFHPRCAYAIPECSRNQPRLEAFRTGHEAACLRLEQVNAD